MSVTGARLKPQRRDRGKACWKRQDLAAIRGERLVFVGIRFAVPAGGALVLSGPNGAGKSTLLRVLAGLCRAEAGRVLWRGEDALAAARWKRVAISAISTR